MNTNIEDVLLAVESELALPETPADEFESWSMNYFSNHRKRYRSDIKLIQRIHPGGAVLELGSAPFHLTAILKQLGMSVTGVDIDPSRFSGFIDRMQLEVVKCDVETEELPFPAGSFKLVLFNEVFEHMRINPIETLLGRSAATVSLSMMPGFAWGKRVVSETMRFDMAVT